MKRETRERLARAMEDLAEARKIRQVGLSRSTARAAYYAAFHAAEAFIFELSGKGVKTHSGVRAEFSRLLRSAGHIEPELTAFLSEGYGYKEIADYGFGEAAEITAETASAAVVSAERFVNRIEKLLDGGKPPGSGNAA